MQVANDARQAADEVDNDKLREAAERIAELETLCAEAMGEMPKEWRDRFRKCLNSKKH